jgi:deoxyadenosine/deoxycytidine kinase
MTCGGLSNTCRKSNSMKICVIGNIASGKSTVVHQLMRDMPNSNVHIEPVEEWGRLLDLMYEDPCRWSSTFNTRVLLSYYKWIDEKCAVFERSPMCSLNVFVKAQFEAGHMTQVEMNLFSDLHDAIAWTPEVLVYIRTAPETCFERMKGRSRQCENSVTLEYLRKIHINYEAMVRGACAVVHTVDGHAHPDIVYDNVKNIVDIYI